MQKPRFLNDFFSSLQIGRKLFVPMRFMLSLTVFGGVVLFVAVIQLILYASHGTPSSIALLVIGCIFMVIAGELNKFFFLIKMGFSAQFYCARATQFSSTLRARVRWS